MFANKNILIIDDSTTIRNHLSRVFIAMGAIVEGAETGESGLKKWASRQFDLILVDLLLPDIDGIQIIKTIREKDETSAVVVVTGTGGIKSATVALQQGADGFLEKQDMIVAEQTAFYYSLEQALERRTNINVQRCLQAEIAEKVEQLKISEQVALEASRAKSTFLANMSHELRTPLNAIIGFVQLMERDPTLSPQQGQYLATIMRSGGHLLALINDVLSLSKIEAGKVTLNEQVFDLRRLLQGLEEMFYMRCQAKHLNLTFVTVPDVPQWVFGDEGKLRQILINLLGNAVKFTESGSVRLDVSWKDGQAMFQVTDTGPGIAQSEMSNLFEPFMQTQTGRKYREGTGLGLALSRNFVNLCGGEISVESRVGEGTTFRFHLKLPMVEEGLSESKPRRVIGLDPAGPRSYRLLVVDDQWESRAVLTNLFTLVGFEVFEANDGEAGVKAWRELKPDLIWMDLQMPTMDGYEATRIIRNLEAEAPQTSPNHRPQPHIPIIAVTASAFEETKDKALAVGCDDFISKPFPESVVFEKITKHLGVKFLYADPQEDKAIEDFVVRKENPITQERLATIPAGLLARLHKAAVSGDLKDALNIVGQIQEVNEPLGNELTALVKSYRFEEVEDLIKSAMAPNQEP